MKLIHHILASLLVFIVACPGFAKSSIIIDRIDCMNHPNYSVYFHLECDPGSFLDSLDANDIRIIDNKTTIGSIKKLTRLRVNDSTGIVLIDMRGYSGKKQIAKAFHVVQKILNKSRYIREVSWFVLKSDGFELIDPIIFSRNNQVVASYKRKDGESHFGLFDAINSIQSQEVIAKKGKKVFFLFTHSGNKKGSTSLDELKKQISINRVKVIWLHSETKQSDKAIMDLVHHSGGSVVDMTDWQRSYNAFETLGNTYCIEYRSNIADSKAPNEIELQFARDGHIISAFSKVYKNKNKVMLPCTVNMELIVLICIGIGGLLLILILGYIFREIRSVKKLASNQYSHHENEASNRALSKIPEDARRESMSLDYGSGTNEMYSAWLIIKNDGMSIGKMPIFGAELIIGTSKDCGLIINDESLSKTHAKIKSQLGNFFLYDLVSDQGTYLNGKKLIRPKQLHDWDEIRLGESILIFRGHNT